MNLPEAVQEVLNDESVAARVDLGGGDVLCVTPGRTLVYRSEGLLSDESVTEYPHGAERIAVDRGRRKSTVTLDYGLDGERTLRLPTDRLEDALHPVLAGVLNRAGVTRPGETIKETFLLSELTVVVTSERLVRHVGAAVWDEEFDEYHYDDVTDLRFETGNVGTSVVVRLGDEQERFKVPNDRARAFRECLVAAVLDYHGYGSLDAFREARAPSEADDGDETEDTVDFGGRLDPLSAEPMSLDDTGGEAPEAAERTASTRGRSNAGRSAASGSEDGGTTGGETGNVPSGEAGSTAGEPGNAAGEAGRVSSETPTTPGTGSGGGGTGTAQTPEPDAGSAAGTGSDPDPAGEAPVDAGGEGAGDDDFAAAGFEPAGPVDEGELAEEVAALREAVEEQNELLRAQGRRIEKQGKLFRRLVEELRESR